MTNSASAIRLIGRPTLIGIGEHVGVALPSGQVVHRTARGNEVSTLSAFAQGKPVREIARADPRRTSEVLSRLAATAGRPAPYRLLDSNCEHYGYWALEGQPKSPQVFGLVAMAALGIMLAAA